MNYFFRNMKSNYIIYIIFLLIISTECYSQDSIDQYKALRLKSELGFEKPYRILETTFKSIKGFQTYYPGTKITLEIIIRYHLYTEIKIDQKENRLISMDQTEFKLKNIISEQDLTKKTVDLIGDMFFGVNEVRGIRK